MGSRNGFITLDRSILDSWVWQLTPGQRCVWLTMLADARWKAEPAKIRFQGILIEVKRGELWTTERTLAKRAGVTRKVVRTALRVLREDGAIRAQERAHLGTLVTITNYDRYQAPWKHKGPAQGPVGAHPGPNKNAGKKEKQGDSAPQTARDLTDEEILNGPQISEAEHEEAEQRVWDALNNMSHGQVVPLRRGRRTRG